MAAVQDKRKSRSGAAAICTLFALLTAIVDYSVFAHGLPMLRHDWRFPNAQAAMGPALADFFSGWLTAGIGSVQPYPTFYYLGFLLWPLHAFLSPLACVVIIVTAAVVILVSAARSIAASTGTGTLGAVGLSAFAVLNPWVYAKLIAGHIMMVLAYALIVALVAEILRPRPRTMPLIVLSALLVTQIEFCAIAIVPLGIWLLRARRHAPAIALLASVLPIAAGLVASYTSLLHTPYNLQWQRAESVPLLSGLTLTGYQFGYDRAFEHWRWAVAVCAAIAAAGAWTSRRYGLERVVIAASGLCLLLASGTSGPIAPLYAFAVTHITESGLFRELYDLLGILAAGYIVLIARQLAVSRFFAVIFCAAAWALAIPWLTSPAFTWFVSGSVLPQPPLIHQPLARVAYFPAFQPLSHNGKGSGVDPDAFAIPGFAMPLNEASPTYPVNVALVRAQQGNMAELAALSVSQIITRSDYESRWDSLRSQLAFNSRIVTGTPVTQSLNALPLASIYESEPRSTSIGDGLWELSTAPESTVWSIFKSDRSSLDPRRAWINATAAFVARPDWGNPWGGVATAAHTPLPLPVGTRAILAQTSGRLTDARGRTIAVKTATPHWWAATAASVRCDGECLVIAASPKMSNLPEHSAPAYDYRPLTLRQIMPWLAIVDVSASRANRTLRYNVAYDDGWAAFDGSRHLPHLRLDGTFNAWIVPAKGAPARIAIVQIPAAVQFGLEILALGIVLVLLGAATRRSNTFQLLSYQNRVHLHGSRSRP